VLINNQVLQLCALVDLLAKLQHSWLCSTCDLWLQAADAELEQQRLTEKLDTNLVCGIWLQMGSDVAKLRAGLKYIQAEFSRRRLARPPVVFGMLPSLLTVHANIACQSQRPFKIAKPQTAGLSPQGLSLCQASSC
jgi:hypothetical protein